ncbi:hydantoinase/carbamoylase family amidase [Caballeronia sp. LZ032]|uniref:hydantoinase/carbamoylase family amidase n=1 Tax=Caballeronia sp. LZ032 TaxID=3038565 RepID=UPI0028639843|nr:hydantoinase/carbamoylase family amidase [Caballeronia sp. LZ032]MDR5880261.1 hydantoinase/carbamoylase family amidase [Caballeronia sp. LZ032]
MTASTDYAHIAQQLFDTVREATAEGRGVTRASYGAGESRALDLLTAFAQKQGFAAHVDRAGNVTFSHPDDARTRPILCGSHMDSVPEGGNFDGLAGVIAGLLCLMRQRDEGQRGMHPLRVLALRGEESAWFGKAYIGSSALFGRLPPTTLDAQQRSTGETLAACMREAGADVEAIAAGEVLLDANGVAGYIELHIEQGALLDDAQRAVAIVPSIRGNVRYRNVRCIGEPGHSGAVPRERRHDAVFAAAHVVSALDTYWKRALAEGADLVITCGVFGTRAEQHAISRIPGEVDFSFEARSADPNVLAQVLDVFEHTLADTAASHGVRFETGALLQTAPAHMDAGWIGLLEQHAQTLNLPAPHVPSGAGHDAAMFAAAGIRSAMIFVRNQNGSHNPDEAMRLVDFMDGVALLYETINAFA